MNASVSVEQTDHCEIQTFRMHSAEASRLSVMSGTS